MNGMDAQENNTAAVEPMVSVLVPTYQHEDHIAACLDSILAQRTTFPFEVLVGEDGSTDGTRAICERYAAAYADRIQVEYRSRKDVIHIQGKPTGRANLISLLTRARGRYIALCEGDDYWVDPDKLQAQVDLMERELQCTMCFTRSYLDKGGVVTPKVYPEGVDLHRVSYGDLLEHGNFIATASVLFRNVLKPLPAWLRKIPFADQGLYLLLSRKGEIRGLDRISTVYRIVSTGAWSGLKEEQRIRSYLLFYRYVAHLLTAEERTVLENKLDERLEQLAHLRYPVSPRKKALYKRILKLGQGWSHTLVRLGSLRA